MQYCIKSVKESIKEYNILELLKSALRTRLNVSYYFNIHTIL